MLLKRNNFQLEDFKNTHIFKKTAATILTKDEVHQRTIQIIVITETVKRINKMRCIENTKVILKSN